MEHRPTSSPAKVWSCERSARLQSHKPLVRKIARRLDARTPAHVHFDELVQAGMIGLNDAISRFEEGKGASFDTYAARRIEGAMVDSLRSADTLTRSARARIRDVRSAVHRLENRLGRTARAKEVADELGWTLDEFHDCMVEAGAGGARFDDAQLELGASAAITSLEQLDDDSLAPVDECADPLSALQQRQRHAALNAAFDALDERERHIMDMIYNGDVSQRAVGAALGLSPSRICKMHDEIVAKLKRRLRDW